jgi:hypothetical protein
MVIAAVACMVILGAGAIAWWALHRSSGSAPSAATETGGKYGGAAAGTKGAGRLKTTQEPTRPVVKDADTIELEKLLDVWGKGK